MLCCTLGPKGSCLNEAVVAIKVAALLFVAQTNAVATWAAAADPATIGAHRKHVCSHQLVVMRAGLQSKVRVQLPLMLLLQPPLLQMLLLLAMLHRCKQLLRGQRRLPFT